MWEVIENKINNILSWLKRITGIQWLEKTIKSFIAKFKSRQINKSKKLKEKGAELSKQVQAGTKKALTAFRSVDVKKIRLKPLFAILGLILLPLANKIKLWCLALKPGTIAIVSMISAVGIVGGISIYKSVENISDQEQKEEVKEQVYYGKPRKIYHNVDSKQLLVYQVSIPIYIESATDVRTLIIDFTLEMSNRYLKEYFLANDHLIKDRLGHSMEEIIPEFPLTLEGQQIIKEKILKEVNLLIKDLKIKGKAKNIFFNSILAG